MEEFSAKRNLARVGSGMSGGPFYKTLNTAPKMNFVEGWPDTTLQKLGEQSIPKPAIMDVWASRRSNAGGS